VKRVVKAPELLVSASVMLVGATPWRLCASALPGERKVIAFGANCMSLKLLTTTGMQCGGAPG